MKILYAKDEATINRCFDVLKALRPDLQRDTFTKKISSMIENGYNLCYIEESEKALCAAGFRYVDMLAWGKAIYIDDLSTLPQARGRGFANALLDHIIQVAKEKKLNQVHLDSGCNESRYDAHRLYLKKGFNITSHHFAYRLQ